jgi:hypothetical protein
MIVVHFAKFSALYTQVVISLLARRLEDLLFLFLHFLLCMTQRSLHVVTNVYYGSYARLCLGGHSTLAMLRFHGVVHGTMTPLAP